jgi:NADH-quinone oxidoreductase subunit C
VTSGEVVTEKETSAGPAASPLSARAIFERLAEGGRGDRGGPPEGALAFEEETAAEGHAGTRDACVRLASNAAAALPDVMRRLRDDQALAFDFLQNLTAVDWIKRDAIELVYHLFSYAHRHTIALKVDLPRATARVPSVAALWPSANWMEREQFDLLGVVFEGHPDLRRLLMPDDWPGHPMRKDYREAKAYRGMPTTRPSPLDQLRAFDLSRAHTTGPASVRGPAAAAKDGGET